jgi:hypothetical protein
MPPTHLRDGFFETDEFRAAFESQHIGKVFRAYRNHPRHLQLFGKALNQELLGRWLGLTQAQVSKLENGKPEVAVQPSWRDYAAVVMSGVRAGGSHAPVVNSWVIASRVSRPHLVAVDR